MPFQFLRDVRPRYHANALSFARHTRDYKRALHSDIAKILHRPPLVRCGYELALMDYPRSKRSEISFHQGETQRASVREQPRVNNLPAVREPNGIADFLV